MFPIQNQDSQKLMVQSALNFQEQKRSTQIFISNENISQEYLGKAFADLKNNKI